MGLITSLKYFVPMIIRIRSKVLRTYRFDSSGLTPSILAACASLKRALAGRHVSIFPSHYNCPLFEFLLQQGITLPIVVYLLHGSTIMRGGLHERSVHIIPFLSHFST